MQAAIYIHPDGVHATILFKAREVCLYSHSSAAKDSLKPVTMPRVYVREAGILRSYKRGGCALEILIIIASDAEPLKEAGLTDLDELEGSK